MSTIQLDDAGTRNKSFIAALSASSNSATVEISAEWQSLRRVPAGAATPETTLLVAATGLKVAGTVGASEGTSVGGALIFE